jgi:hypothetical protein
MLQASYKIISNIAQPYMDYGPRFKLDFVEFKSLTFNILTFIFVGKIGVQLFFTHGVNHKLLQMCLGLL